MIRQLMRWRVLFLVAGVITFTAVGTVFLTHNQAYDANESWMRCNDDRPNLRMTGCTGCYDYTKTQARVNAIAPSRITIRQST